MSNATETPAARHPHFADYTDARLAGILAMARERALAQPEGSPEHATARRAEAWVLVEQAHRSAVKAS